MTLLDDIELFLATHKMAPSRFGHEALRDRHFVFNLRSGRRIWPDTESSVRRFMASYKPQEKAA